VDDEKQRVNDADDVDETGRLTITAIKSALSRTYPGIEPSECIKRLRSSSGEDDQTKEYMAIALQYQYPAKIDSPHRWFVELLTKALALIASHG
jgi:hypothetical protein